VSKTPPKKKRTKAKRKPAPKRKPQAARFAAERARKVETLKAIVAKQPKAELKRFAAMGATGQRLWGYRKMPSLWALDYLQIELARYRSQEELEAWLATQPPESHEWCRRQLVAGKLQLDPTRSYQGEYLDAMAEPGTYALRCANGIAKTATAAIMCHWFLDVYPPDGPGGARVVTTAGTWGQVKEQLWREIHVWEGQSKKGPSGKHMSTKGSLNVTSIDLLPNWAAIARASDKAATFEGIHGDRVLIIVDEAKAVRASLFGAFRRLMRGSQTGQYWFVFLSSPGSPTGTFWEMTEGSLAHKTTTFGLSAYESSRISLDTIAEDSEDLGEDSPLFISMDLGLHPEEGDDVVVPLSWAQAAVGREVNTKPYTVLGIDVARKGRHETALVSLTGRHAKIEATRQGKRTTWTAGKVIELHKRLNFGAIAVDDTGVGGGLSDQLVAAEELKGVHILEVNFGAKADDEEHYVNIKAEMEFMARAELEAGFNEPDNPLAGLSLPDDKKLISQITSEHYDYDAKQRYKIERPDSDDDDEIMLEKSPSPDRAHALFLANYARAQVSLLERSGRLDKRVEELTIDDGHHIGLAADIMREDF